MRILSVKLGSVDIPVKRFVNFIAESVLKKDIDMEIISDDDVKFLSNEQNIRMLDVGDARIAKLGRDYLFTYAMTKKQQGKLIDFLKRNHITVEFEQPISEWLTATKSEQEHLGAQ